MTRTVPASIVIGQEDRSMGKVISRSPRRRTPPKPVPLLQNGDRLTRDEFERRYEAMPELKKAELVEGVVYLPSPVKQSQHGRPHALVINWLVSYSAGTPGVDFGCESTVRLDLVNEPQPDACLFLLPEHGGRARISEDDYLEGAPELIVEVAATSASYDLHSKLTAYRRNGVREYVVWRVLDRELDWFALKRREYRLIPAGPKGIRKSLVFPGLWLDPAALIRGSLPGVLKALEKGLGSPEHRAFVARLGRQGESRR
jgi:Uma2 family endonuclease